MQSKGRYDTPSMGEARDQLTRLPEMFEQMLKLRDGMPVIEVTRRNKPVLAILPWELFKSILETLEILEDDEQMMALRQALREVSAVQGKSWKKLKQEQGWDELASRRGATLSYHLQSGSGGWSRFRVNDRFAQAGRSRGCVCTGGTADPLRAIFAS